MSVSKAAKFRCVCCGRLRPLRVSGQKYCSEKACQFARKNRWRREKYGSDSDYRLNQKESTATWLESRGGAATYYRDYRRRKNGTSNQSMTDGTQSQTMAPVTGPNANKRQATEEAKNSKRTMSVSQEPGDASLFAVDAAVDNTNANSDESTQNIEIKTGIYRIYPAHANSDAFLAEIRVITET